MKPVDDIAVMAYVDGELDAAARDEIEREIDADAALAARVREMAALRRRLRTGLDEELAEPVPDRLLALLRPDAARAPSAAPVIDLGAARARRDAGSAAAPAARSTWRQWGGMAASLLLGIVLARLWPSGDGVAFEQRAGALVAAGELATALSTRLAGDRAGDVSVQLSFVGRSGAYCRTFVFDRSAGLACREGDSWVVEALAATEPGQRGEMRQAASQLPAAILEAVDQRIAGPSLDPAAERSARDAGWPRR